MKTIKIQYKILLSGFPNRDEEYNIDEFKLKKEIVNQDKIKERIDKEVFDTGIFIKYCIVDKLGTILYLENDELIDFQIQNKFNLSENKVKLLLEKYKSIIEKVKNTINKIKLTLDIPVEYPMIRLNIFDENNEFICDYVQKNYITFWNRLEYISTNEKDKNFASIIESKYWGKIREERINRALNFFYTSFDSNSEAIRFIMLISSLESLFNYKLSSQNSITKRVSELSAKILSVFNQEKCEENYNKVKKIYNIRSKYIHGEKNKITIEDERLLRRIVRIIIIFYIIVHIDTNWSIGEIINYINGDPEKVKEEYKEILKLLIQV